jgi:hypothetical protein
LPLKRKPDWLRDLAALLQQHFDAPQCPRNFRCATTRDFVATK